jgi:hypothetical protein
MSTKEFTQRTIFLWVVMIGAFFLIRVWLPLSYWFFVVPVADTVFKAFTINSDE